MKNLLKIPDVCKLKIDTVIPLSKIQGINSSVKKIIWFAKISPDLIEVVSKIDDTDRYEEIQILFVKVDSTENLFDSCKSIYKSIKYPCLLIINYNNKYLFSACQFNPGQRDYNENILQSIVFSHWIHTDLLSENAKKFIDSVNNAINNEKKLEKMYNTILDSIIDFSLHGTTKAFTYKIVDELASGISSAQKDILFSDCTPYRIHYKPNESKPVRYDKSKRSSSYKYSYDYEDIWYCLNKSDLTKKSIIGRRIRNIEELVYLVESKIYQSF